MAETEQQNRQTKMLKGPIGRTLIGLGLPMALGILAIMLFNIVDTIYVGRLGSSYLAAMSFTFPVTFAIMSLAMGLSIGISSTIARALGQGNQSHVKRLTTDGLTLAVVVVLIFSLVGLMLLDPIFKSIGASEETLPLIRSYMVTWFLGVGLLVIPMLTNGAIRATGDTKTPAIIMLIAGMVNIIVDPFLIFGIGPLPRLELHGAALATVISWLVTFAASLWVLVRREKMLAFPLFSLEHTFQSWQQILYIGIPATVTKILRPVAMGIITLMITQTQLGEIAVAGYGVSGRLESLAMVGIFGLSSALTPFIGQNFGAGHYGRLRSAVRFCFKLSLGWGGGTLALFFITAPYIASVFNQNPQVIQVTVFYLHILPLSYGASGILECVASTFNAVNKPLHAASLIFIQLIALSLPLAWLGTKFYGWKGIFMGITLANFLIGGIAYILLYQFLRQLDKTTKVDSTSSIKAT
jgi:putative MATE family efflux protein